MKYTYLFQSRLNGLTKIGRSQFPSQRFTGLGGNRNLSVITVIEGDYEASLHQKYKEQRIRGEWFDLSEQQLSSELTDNPFTGFPSLPEGQFVKRNTIDVSPAMKARIRKVAKMNGLPISVIVQVILERALLDFESGKASMEIAVQEASI